MSDRKKNILVVAYSYVFLWVLFLLLVALSVAGILPDGEIPESVRILASWTPTMALLILYKKLFPDSSIGKFYKNAFQERVNWGLIISATVLQVVIMVGSVALAGLTTGFSYGLSDLSFQAISTNIFWSVLTGATGEESCWRGFLQPSLEKKHSVIKSALIVGVIWGFWHIPLWLVSAGSESAGAFILNVVSFVAFCMAISVVMGICYSRCRNLIIPMWLHFMSNFLLTLFTGDGLYIQIWCAVLYALAALGYGYWHIKTSRNVS